MTGRLNAFSPGSKKIHVDIDPSSINKNVPVDVPIVGDAGRVLEALIAAWKRDDDASRTRRRWPTWWRQIDEWRAQATACASRQDMTPGAIIKPQYAIERLYEITRER